MLEGVADESHSTAASLYYETCKPFSSPFGRVHTSSWRSR